MIATVMSTIDSYGFIAADHHRPRPDLAPARRPRRGAPAALHAHRAVDRRPRSRPRSALTRAERDRPVARPRLDHHADAAAAGRDRAARPRPARRRAGRLAAMVAPFVVTLAGWLRRRFRRAGRAPPIPLGIEPIYAGLGDVARDLRVGLGRRSGRADHDESGACRWNVESDAVAIVARWRSLRRRRRARRARHRRRRADTLARVVALPEVVVSTDARRRAHAGRAARRSTRERARSSCNWGQDTPMALGDAARRLRLLRRRQRHRLLVPLDPRLPAAADQRARSTACRSTTPSRTRSTGSTIPTCWPRPPRRRCSAASARRSTARPRSAAASTSRPSPFGETPRVRAALGVRLVRHPALMLELRLRPARRRLEPLRRATRGSRPTAIATSRGRELWSYALAARKRARRAIRCALNLYGGPEETHLAYLGVPRAYLERRRHRRPRAATGAYNPITYEDERDHFFEPHYELIHSWSPGAGLGALADAVLLRRRGLLRRAALRPQSLADYRLAPWATTDPTLFAARLLPRRRRRRRRSTATRRAGSRSSTSTRCGAARWRTATTAGCRACGSSTPAAR